MARRGFTLLESIVALTIIASVAVVCLVLRAQSIARVREIDERRREDLAAQAVLELATSGLLTAPVGPEKGDPLRRITWTGAHAGIPFTCVRVAERVRNPAWTAVGAAAAEDLARTLELDRFTVTCRRGTATALFPRRSRG